MDKFRVGPLILIVLILLTKSLSSSPQLPGVCRDLSILEFANIFVTGFSNVFQVKIVKILAGFGIPIDLEFESVTMGYVLKSEYFLPPNASRLIVNYLAHPLDLTSMPLNNHRLRRESHHLERSDNKYLEQRDGMKSNNESSSFGYDTVLNQKYEKYVVNAVDVESGSGGAIPYENVHSEIDQREQNRKGFGKWTSYPERREQTQNFATTRWFLYKGIAALAKRLFFLFIFSF